MALLCSVRNDSFFVTFDNSVFSDRNFRKSTRHRCPVWSKQFSSRIQMTGLREFEKFTTLAGFPSVFTSFQIDMFPKSPLLSNRSVFTSCISLHPCRMRQILNLPYVREHLSEFITKKEYQIQVRALAEQTPGAVNSPAVARKQLSSTLPQ